MIKLAEEADEDLSDGIEMIEPNHELNEGGSVASSNHHQTRRAATTNSYKYNLVNATNSNHPPVRDYPTPTQTQYIYHQKPTSTKWIYLKAVHQVLLHLLLIYCAIAITYVIFFQSTANCTCPTTASQTTSITQQNNDTMDDVTFDPSPTQILSTLQPTLDASTTNFIGDFKISAQNSSHGNWLLCDGSFIDPNEYPQLFNIIGYSFGSGTGISSGKIRIQHFSLPNAIDRVIGVNGVDNIMGKLVGIESITLNETNIPSHWHFLVYGDTGDECKSHTTNDSYPYLAEQCYDGSDLLTRSSDKYELKATDNYPNRLRSASIGDGEPINIMQPTIFVGNLFIYAD